MLWDQSARAEAGSRRGMGRGGSACRASARAAASSRRSWSCFARYRDMLRSFIRKEFKEEGPAEAHQLTHANTR